MPISLLLTNAAILALVALAGVSCGDRAKPVVTVSRTDTKKQYHWDGVDPKALQLGTEEYFEGVSPGDAFSVTVDFTDPDTEGFKVDVRITTPNAAVIKIRDPLDPGRSAGEGTSSTGAADLVAGEVWARIYARHAPQEVYGEYYDPDSPAGFKLPTLPSDSL